MVIKTEIEASEKIIGLEFTDQERELMVDGLNNHLEKYAQLRKVPYHNSLAPAIQFNPSTEINFTTKPRRFKMSRIKMPDMPSNLEDLAFLPATHLSRLIKNRKVSSLELTQMYIDRLKRYDPKLQCVISLTEELALKQAKKADEELVSGKYRGLLHGIPWGVKDILSTKGYKTTWGAMPYKDQMIDENATVIERLEQAGAVLIAKLTLGELAWGDVWFGGKTKNPWNTDQGSSGSSAGSGSATSAGLVGFSIGTETWGSIVSPSTECGITGLRPTFGRVSRYGAMTLSWSMDKIGPMCRSVEDCALVFNTIYGPDGKDNTVADKPFRWNPDFDIRNLRIGYLKSDFEKDRDDKKWKANDENTLEVLRNIGLNIIPVELPDYPIDAMSLIVEIESATAFDELTRNNKDDLLVRQIKDAWPNVFRQVRFVPAVEYIQANRLRSLVMKSMSELMANIDVYVAPSDIGNNLLLTNLTGHPTVVIPNGFKEEGTPTSICFVGKLYGEAETLALAKAYQDNTDFHLKHPVI